MERQLLSAGRFEALYGFAGRLAHDLNNPLMIVTGYAEELMQALKPSDPLRQDASEILGAARRIGGIAAQLTEFARRQGKTATRVNIGEAIARSAVEIRRGGRRARHRGIEGPIPSPWLPWRIQGQLGEVLAAVVAGTRRSTPRERTRVVIAWDVRECQGASVADCSGCRKIRSHHHSATTATGWTPSRLRACSIPCSATSSEPARRPQLGSSARLQFSSRVGRRYRLFERTRAKVRRSRSICPMSRRKARRPGILRREPSHSVGNPLRFWSSTTKPGFAN